MNHKQKRSAMRAAQHRRNNPAPAQTSKYLPVYLSYVESIPKQPPRPLDAAKYIPTSKSPGFEVFVIINYSYESSFVESKEPLSTKYLPPP